MESHWIADHLYDLRLRSKSACHKKKKYRREEAREKAFEYRGRVAMTFGFMSAYKCFRCTNWHIGHSGKKRALLQAINAQIMNG